MKKMLLIVFGLLVVLVVGIVLYVGANLNELVEKAIEIEGPKITQTTIDLEGVDISFMSGRGELHGLTVGNPKGFDSPYLFKLAKVVMDLNTKSLQGDVIEISEVTIDGASLMIDQKGLQNNLQALQKQVAQATKSSGASPAPVSEPADTKAETAQPAKRIYIKAFNFTNAVLNAKFTDHKGRVTEKEVTIPDIKIENIGTAEKGLTPAEVSAQLVAAIQKEVKAEIRKMGIDSVKKELESKMKEKLNQKLDSMDDDKKALLKQFFK